MAETPGLSDQYRTASPWPVFVALGFALSEIGVFLGLFSVAVAGLLLLGASVTGILRESGYVSQTWQVLAALGAAFALLGLGVVLTQVSPGAVSVQSVIADPNGVVGRGLAIVVAGVVLVAAGATGELAGTPDR